MEERRRILELIEAGEITVEEGVQRLEGLVQPAATTESQSPSPEPAAPPPWVRRFWHFVLWPGVALVLGAVLLLAAVYSRGAASGWLVCGWPLFVLGVLVVILGWWMRSAHWFSLRVRQPTGPKVRLALPLPLGPIAWILRLLRPYVPKLEETGVDEVLLAMRDGLREGDPFVVEVDEGEDGEQVQVYFG